MEDIQKRLGHFEISTTERIYAHFDERSNLPTSNKIVEAFGEEKVAQSNDLPDETERNGKESSECHVEI